MSTPSYDIPVVAPVEGRRASTAPARAEAGWKRVLARLAPLTLPFAIALAVFLLALQSGGYGLEVRGGVAIGIWWALALGVGVLLWPAERIPRMAVVTGGTLATFGLAAGLSLIWADSAELAFGEFNRVMLYLGVFALVVVSARRATAARWADGLAFGVAAVGVLALVSRLFPRRGCPARGNDNQGEHAQVEHHAVELAEGELGAVGPDEGKPGGEPERRERPAVTAAIRGIRRARAAPPRRARSAHRIPIATPPRTEAVRPLCSASRKIAKGRVSGARRAGTRFHPASARAGPCSAGRPSTGATTGMS